MANHGPGSMYALYVLHGISLQEKFLPIKDKNEVVRDIEPWLIIFKEQNLQS